MKVQVDLLVEPFHDYVKGKRLTYHVADCPTTSHHVTPHREPLTLCEASTTNAEFVAAVTLHQLPHGSIDRKAARLLSRCEVSERCQELAHYRLRRNRNK